MEILRIEATIRSPFILLDPENGIIEFSGRSFLEDSELFYKPIIEWIEEYLKSPRPTTTIICRFEYYNNPCSKIIYTTFRRVERSICPSNKLKINWYYKNDDDDMLENGQEFKDSIKNAEFSFIPW